MYGYDSDATVRNIDNIDNYLRNNMNYYQMSPVYLNSNSYNNSENSERDEKLRRAINKWLYL